MAQVSLLGCTRIMSPSRVKLEKNFCEEKSNAIALLDSTLIGITQKIWEVHCNAAEVKRTIFRLKNTETYRRQ
jgi:hypothetical protein